MSKTIKSKIELDELLQTLSNGKKVLDFSKIESKGFPSHLIITQRGSLGKSLNAKELIRKEFEKSKRPSIWLTNGVTATIKIQNEFLKDVRKDFVRNELKTKFWDEVNSVGDVEKNLAEIRLGNETVCKLLALNHAPLMKGARIKYKHIIYDEFNEGTKAIQNKIVEHIDSLLHSTEDLVANSGKEQDLRLWIFGNNKSLNNPLIYSLGVTHLLDEISEVYDEFGNKLMLIIAPQFDEDERQVIENENKQNWIYGFSKQLGTHKHSYFNETISDEINNVKIMCTKELVNNLLPMISLVHKGSYLNIYKNRSDKTFHIVDVSKKDTLVKATYAFQKSDVKENVSLHTHLKKEYIKVLSANKITFENIVTREIFISAIKQ